MLVLTPTQFPAISKEYYHKNAAVPEGLKKDDSNLHYQITAEEKFRDSDSFQNVQFPHLKFTEPRDYDDYDGTWSYQESLYRPRASLKGLDDHLDSTGKKALIVGPKLFYPGLLAQRKYSRLNFKEDTKDFIWDVSYSVHFSPKPVFPKSLDARDPQVELVVEARLQDVDEVCSFPVYVSSDSQLRDFKEQLRGYLDREAPILKSTFWYSRDSKVEGYLDCYILFVATSPEKDYDPSFEANWKELKIMILEELADAVWDCLVKKKPLQTMIMTRKRLKELEEKIKEDAERLEREKKELEEHKRKDNLVSKGVKLKKIDSFS